jgi:hypothetical protein
MPARFRSEPPGVRDGLETAKIISMDLPFIDITEA